MSLEKLDSPQNPTIKAVAKLRAHRARKKTGQIIIDGVREIQRAAASGIHLHSVFLPDGNDDPDLQTLGERTYSVSRRAHEKIAFGGRFEPVAVADRPDSSLRSLAAPTALALYVVLDAVEKPGNIGAVVRTADAAGLDGVILVDALADPFNPNAIRASLGTVFSVPIATCSLAEYGAWAEQHAIASLLAICDAQASEYTMTDYASSRIAIVLGNEATGIGDNWGKIGNTRNVFIPMHGIADSLNVSTAAAVIVYEALRQRKLKAEKNL